jgi:hypothetical protein
MLGKLLARLDEIRADGKIERHNKKLIKLLNKRLNLYQTTVWAFVKAEMQYDNCRELKSIIELAERKEYNND